MESGWLVLQHSVYQATFLLRRSRVPGQIWRPLGKNKISNVSIDFYNVFFEHISMKKINYRNRERLLKQVRMSEIKNQKGPEWTVSIVL